MSYQQTTALHKIANLKKRIRVIQGGTSAGKTIAILMYLIDLALKYDGISVSVVAESVPHLKRGAIRDFLNIIKEQNYYVDDDWNRTDSIYRFSNGSYVEFFNADDPAKMRGARRDVLFINEANNIKHSAFEQLEVRTRRLVILDYNPVAEFWAHTDIVGKIDCDFIILTYKDNEALEASIIASIESRQHNENWWRVYGLGEVGVLEGQIYTNWEVINELPSEARLERYGVDFGFTNDPTAIIGIYKYNDSLVIDEKAYQTGLHNDQIANLLRQYENLEPASGINQFNGFTTTLAVADEAEPKSISEIRRYGVNIHKCSKGRDSVRHGIETVQNQKLLITERSVNVLKELRNYLWKVDKDGNSLNIPEHEFSHSMDAIRYGIVDLVGKPKVRVFTNKPTGF